MYYKDLDPYIAFSGDIEEVCLMLAGLMLAMSLIKVMFHKN